MSHLKKFTSLFLLGGLFALIALFSVQPATAHAEHAESMAYIRVIHASPDAGVVDVFVDGNKLLSSFQFGVVTPYVPLPSGKHNVQIAVIGTGVGASVITQSIMITAGTPYTVAALGTKASGYSLSVFTDDNLISNNDAKVRVYHLSPGTGNVNVSNGTTSVASGLAYQKASDYIAIPAGSYKLDATLSPSQNITIGTTLKPWTVTSVFAIGVENGNPAIQFISTQVAGMPGMPGTGSDPNAASVTSVSTHSTTPWLPTAFALVIAALAVGFMARRSRKA